MAARSIGSGTLSFGLVSIPIRFYVATHSERVSFNMLHGECGTRIKQQLYCPHCERVVDRDEIVKGYQFAKDQYVTFEDEEIKALEAEANRSIDIQEFVPLDKVDPIYFENAHYPRSRSRRREGVPAPRRGDERDRARRRRAVHQPRQGADRRHPAVREEGSRAAHHVLRRRGAEHRRRRPSTAT